MGVEKTITTGLICVWQSIHQLSLNFLGKPFAVSHSSHVFKAPENSLLMEIHTPWQLIIFVMTVLISKVTLLYECFINALYD